MSDKIEYKSYSFEKKKKLANKISKMRNKKHLKRIKKIIFDNNPDINAKKNSQGYLMFFHNYENKTYYILEKYLDLIEKNKIDSQIKTITDTSDLMMSSEDNARNGNSTDYSKMRTRLRYSNKEKRLIKRKVYETDLDKNKDEKLKNSIFQKSDKN
jgi:hypothetical protein